VVTSVVLAAGFCIYLASQMVNIQRFGLLIALVVVMALFLDLICTPALLRLLYGRRDNVSQSGDSTPTPEEDVRDEPTPEPV
jgi:predicted RND superfamily exporter protein